MFNLGSGPFSICQKTLQAGSDAHDYHELSWDYDTAEEAWADVLRVAEQEGAAAEELCVIRMVERPSQGAGAGESGSVR